jgi:hypothetical protein
MAKLHVSYTKLKKYIEQQGGYDLDQEKDAVTLSFVPAFPEALEKGCEGSSPPRVIMHGRLTGDLLVFDSVEIGQDQELRAKDYETAEFTYRSWLQFIEDNY